MKTKIWSSASLVALACSALLAAPAFAQAPAADDNDDSKLAEIIVTAQKRAESVNKVPMSITAFSGADLVEQGVNGIGDLQKVTPGLQISTSTQGTPILTIRGVGFNEASVGATPTVGVYVDEAPLPFSAMTPIALLDVERVEVLKGPQGTLFGQNTTGGTINFIAAKPKDHFEAGGNLTAERFGRIIMEGYASGPVTDTFGVRVAVKGSLGGNWQKSYVNGATIGTASRIGMKSGRSEQVLARVIGVYQPTDTAKITINLNYFSDQGDTQVPQFSAIRPLNPQLFQLFFSRFNNFPTPPRNNRAADWDPNLPPKNDQRQFQGTLRGEFELSDALTLTSITAYADYKQAPLISLDGVSFGNEKFIPRAQAKTFSQELRLAGQIGEPLRFIIGANYAHSDVDQATLGIFGENSNGSIFQLLFNDPVTSTTQIGDQKFKDRAVFGNVDYTLSDAITLHGGIRYAEHDIDYAGCSADSGDNNFGRLFAQFAPIFGGAPVTIPPGGCATFDPVTIKPVLYQRKFNENNLSWRAGVDFKPANGILLYANVSRGYKSGSFPITSAATTDALTPVTQESLLAYEAGYKATLFDRTLQLNGAVFYYDYKDKQVLIQANFPVFGQLEKLLNIPKSRIKGAEAELSWLPVPGLTIRGGGTYLDAKVRKGIPGVFDIFGNPINLAGEPLPNTPKWQGRIDAEYEWAVGSDLKASFGGTLSGQSKSYGAFGQFAELEVKPYATLDLRAGIGAADDRWRVSVFGRNVTNKYYWTDVDRLGDTVTRWTGRPFTFGMTLSAKVS